MQVITYLSMIVAAAFAVLFIMTFDPYVTEIIVGTAYFLNVLNVIYYYFGPKVHTPPIPPRTAREISFSPRVDCCPHLTPALCF